MKPTEIIDEHLLIRQTVGYDFLKNIELCDLPNVLRFLMIVWNYQKMQNAQLK